MPLRLRRVAGLEGRCNDVVLQAPATRATDARTLIYFPGDVQDYPEVMQAHRDYKNYMKWNLENTARMLGQLFPTSYVAIVRPSRIEYKSFSCYDNFVPSNNAGVPDHTPTHGALLHLERLLQTISNRVKSLPNTELLEAVSAAPVPEDIDIEDLHHTTLRQVLSEAEASDGENGSTKPNAVAEMALNMDIDNASKPNDPLWWRHELALEQSALSLVGFSKGCVVLNQLIYEFHYTQTLTPGDEHMTRFISRIESMYWLDGGHAGGKNTWITARSLLETLTRLNMEIYVHVSPYQVQDEGRPWIGREEKAFTSLLRKLGANVQRYLHERPGTPHSLLMHFEVLANFKRVQDSGPPPNDYEDA